MYETINLDLTAKGQAQAKLEKFLGDRFYNYQDVCKKTGARFHPSTKSNRVELQAVPNFVKNLEAEGFRPRISEKLSKALKVYAAEARKDIEAAGERAAEVDTALKAQGKHLFPFQGEGISWIAGRKKALLSDQMGLGKTIQALVAAPKGAPVVVICPAAVKGKPGRPGGWCGETAAWRPDLKVTVLSGRGSFRYPRTFPEDYFEVCHCAQGGLPLDADVGEDVPKEAKNVSAPVQDPTVLGQGGLESPTLGEVRGPVVDKAPKAVQPVDESTVGVPDLDGPSPLVGDVLDRPLPIQDAGDVAKGGRVGGEVKGAAGALPAGGGDTSTDHGSAEPIAADPNAAASLGVGKPPRKKRRRSADLGIGKSSPAHKHYYKAELLILNWDILPATVAKPHGEYEIHTVDPKFGKPLEGTVLIADEVHAVKGGKKTLRGTRFKALSKAVREAGGRVWGLTGTSLLNRPPELWRVLSGLGLERDAFGSWKNFCRLFRGHYGTFGYEWGKPREEEVVEALRNVSLRRKRTEVLKELPTKTYTEVPAVVDKAALKACAAVIQKLEAAGFKLDVETDNPKVAAKLLASAQAIAFEEIAAAREELARAKIPALLSFVEEYERNEEPLVVFSCHRAPVLALGVREGWATITGDVPASKRADIVADFQAGKYKGIALTVAAGGVGITLTHAAHVAFVDLDWTPALNEQAEDRVCRIGQDRGVVVTRIVAEHFLDQRVAELLTKKAELIDASTDAASVGLGEAGTLADDLEKAARVGRVKSSEGAAPNSPKSRKPSSGGAPASKKSPRHGPETPTQEWAKQALLTLAALDPDRALEENGVGFNGVDGEFGHSLAEQLQASGELTDKQWSAGARLCAKYWRQVGRVPAE